MGRITVNNAVKMTFDDRALAHLQAAIFAKLRVAEPFTLTWKDDSSTGGGRTTMWLHSGVNLVFRYETSERPRLNHAWVHALTVTAGAPSGMYLVPEPPAGTPQRTVTPQGPAAYPGGTGGRPDVSSR
ncbi:ATP-dependent DNA ligase [Microbacterium paraoxydans]|uniref:DUF7882 family protein n=1 Tax=Microbacterium paraoxydans TaxID=199592 RepID=UPI00352BDDB4